MSHISNRPISCCIRHYGVKDREEDAGKADAGKGKRWQRILGSELRVIKLKLYESDKLYVNEAFSSPYYMRFYYVIDCKNVGTSDRIFSH